MKEYPKPLTKECIHKIFEQMNNLFYKINENDEKFDIGFFCFIKYQQSNIPALIIINKKKSKKEYINFIDISINNEIKKIKVGDKIH